METKNQNFENSLRCLQHPLSLLSITLLLLNDHIFKVISPSWLTGKLSDFAGLFFFPFVVATALSFLLSRFKLKSRDLGQWAFGFVAIWFLLLKTIPLVNHISITLISKIHGYPVQVLLDASDILALIVLWPSWILWNQASDVKKLRMHYLPLMLAVLASLATSPALPEVEVVTHVMAQNGSFIAFDITNGTRAISEDGGGNWARIDGSQFDEFPNELRSLPMVVCLPDQQDECYRIDGQKIVEESDDGGKTWEISWQLPPERSTYLERINSDIKLGPYDLLMIQWENQDYVLVAVGGEGILRKKVPGGEWERVQVRNAIPTPYASTSLSNTFSAIWMELLIWFFISIITFIAACWIVWLSNSKTSELHLSRMDWIFSPALSPLLGIFLTLFIGIVVGFILLALIQITGFISDIQNGLLVFFALCMVIVLGLLPATIYRRLNRWKLILIQHDCPAMIAQRLVVTSYLSHVFVFVVGTLVWLSWTFGIISRYSLALVSGLICTGLIAMFFLKKIQDLSRQHETMSEK